MHNPLSWLAESIKWEKGVIIWLHRKGGGHKRPATLFLKYRAKCWSIIEYLLVGHRLHKYTEVSCLQLIWLSRKWQILKENWFWWVMVNYCLSLFSVFSSLKYLNQSSLIFYLLTAWFTLRSPIKDQIMLMSDYFKRVWQVDN